MNTQRKMLPIALMLAMASGAVYAQTQRPALSGSSSAAGTTQAPGTGTIGGTTTTGTVVIDPTTGTITTANGTTTSLVPGSTVIVLPSPSATTVGANGNISGVVVPLDSAQVRAILTAFAGSSSNLTSLEQGLRTGSSIALSGAFGSTTFTSPMQFSNATDATQALLLASSQLAALGITQPTPQQIQAVLTGGATTNASGQSVALPGILLLRNRGFSFAQIAQTIGPAPILNPTAQTPVAGGLATSPLNTTRPSGVRAGTAASSSATAGTTNNTPVPQGSSSSAPPVGSASATRGSPNATGGAGLR
jgi:hypothetical protein